uniref:Carbohydrate sulfotransferase n=1 Tax=Falco tinnunculus TaxID=100819 RepID=A0A8C4UIY0_FALTI
MHHRFVDRPVASCRKFCTPRLQQIKLFLKKHTTVILSEVIVTHCEGIVCLARTAALNEKGGVFVHIQMSSLVAGAFPNPTEDWLAIQNDRKSTLASVCLKNNFLKSRSKPDSHIANQLFVEHKHKFIYCEVPKVGCSNWKRTIFLLQADLNAEASEIEHDHIHQTSLIKKLATYPPATQKVFLSNYTKVMFTRHPLERLVSAYRDKLLHSEPFYSITPAQKDNIWVFPICVCWSP